MDIVKPIISLVLNPDEDISQPVKLAEDRSFYRNLKRVKRIPRKSEDIFFDLQDNEVALVGATFCGTKNPAVIVYRMSYMCTIDAHPKGVLIYVCAKRDGLYYYPKELLLDMLMSQQTVYYLQDYKDHQEFVWRELPTILGRIKTTLKGG